MVRFSKYEFYNKLLDSITLFIVTLDITYTQPLYIYIYIYIYLLCVCGSVTLYTFMDAVHDFLVSSNSQRNLLA